MVLASKERNCYTGKKKCDPHYDGDIEFGSNTQEQSSGLLHCISNLDQQK